MDWAVNINFIPLGLYRTQKQKNQSSQELITLYNRYHPDLKIIETIVNSTCQWHCMVTILWVRFTIISATKRCLLMISLRGNSRPKGVYDRTKMDLNTYPTQNWEWMWNLFLQLYFVSVIACNGICDHKNVPNQCCFLTIITKLDVSKKARRISNISQNKPCKLGYQNIKHGTATTRLQVLCQVG